MSEADNIKAGIIRREMVEAVATRFGTKAEKKRCPSIRKMAYYITVKHPDWKVRVDETSTYKQTQSAGMRYYTGGGSREYVGKVLTVWVDGKVIIDHDTTETYRANVEVARAILRQEDKTNEVRL